MFMENHINVGKEGEDIACKGPEQVSRQRYSVVWTEVALRDVEIHGVLDGRRSLEDILMERLLQS